VFDPASVAYVAPEQVRGERVDGRADLYSLGCIVHELLAGRPPFAGSASRLARSYADPRPVPLARHVGGVPPAFEEIVIRLLSRSPSDRFASADDLARALEAIGAHDPEAEALPPSRPVVHAPVFVDRNEILALFEAQLASVEEGRGGIVFVKGPSGHGKTRVLTKACAIARERGIFAAFGSAVPRLAGADAVARGSVPLAALRSPLKSRRRSLQVSWRVRIQQGDRA
jgi:hypothetical protein